MNKKNLVKTEVLQHLKKYNDKEIFYQKYSVACKNKDALSIFLKQYDQTHLRKERIYVEEILPKSYEEFIDEESMWDNQKTSIYIEKYSRFMPSLSAIHNYFEVVYIVENNMPAMIGEKIITLQQGDICFISPGTLHSPHVMENTIALQMTVRKSTFRQEFFRCLSGNSLTSEFFLNALYLQSDGQTEGSVIVFHMKSDEEIKNAFFQIYQEHYNKDVGYQNIMNNLFEILLCYLLRCDPSNIEIIQTHTKFDTRITQILQFIENNCEKVTIEELSQEFHLTKSYLSKYITRKTGKTFSHILQEMRLEKARSMLCSSNLRVEDISQAVGYNNVEHFIRLFRSKYSKTPNQFRKENSSYLTIHTV